MFPESTDKWRDIWKTGHHIFWIVSRKVCRMSQTGSVCEVWDSLSDRVDLLLIQQGATCFSLSFLKEELKQYASRNSNSRQSPDYSGPDAARSCSKSFAWNTWAAPLLVFRYLAECPSSQKWAGQGVFIGLGTIEIPFLPNGKEVLWTSGNLHVITWLLLILNEEHTGDDSFSPHPFPFHFWLCGKQGMGMLHAGVWFIHSWSCWDSSNEGSRT